jgi:hypothetical protein
VSSPAEVAARARRAGVVREARVIVGRTCSGLTARAGSGVTARAAGGGVPVTTCEGLDDAGAMGARATGGSVGWDGTGFGCG